MRDYAGLVEFHWLYLHLKALWLNDDYAAYCTAQRESDIETQQELESKFPYLNELYPFWGDRGDGIAKNNENIEQEVTDWYKRINHKLFRSEFYDFEVVRGGLEFVPKPGVIYITIPRDGDLDWATEMVAKEAKNYLGKAKTISSLSWIKLKQTNWESESRQDAVEKRLEVYYWRECLGLSPIESMQRAYGLKARRWNTLADELDSILESKKVVDKSASISEIKVTETGEWKSQFLKFKKEGQQTVRNVLLEKFPSPNSA